jgi:hypothetical protein
MDEPEGRQPIAGLQQESQIGLRATLSEKIRHVAQDEKQKELLQKRAASDFVRSDPLSIYGSAGAEPVQRGCAFQGKEEQARPESRAAKEKDVQARPKQRKKNQDDIFKSFGTEHDAQAVQMVDGKLKVNYKRFWQSDPDLGRWQQTLAHNKRHDALMFDVKDRASPDFRMEQSNLTINHNALFRQRHQVDSRELGKKAQILKQVKDLQQTIAPQAQTRTKKGVENGTVFDVKRELDGPIRSYGEEQIVNFIGFVLTNNENLESAFRRIDPNGSRASSFGEFTDAMTNMGFRGDVKYIFHRLDTRSDGQLTPDEWMNLKPYMLKEMVRVLSVTRGMQTADAKTNMWLKRAKVELAHDQAVIEALDLKNLVSPTKMAEARPGSAESRSESAPDSPNKTPSDTSGVWGAGNQVAKAQRQNKALEKLPEMQELPKTMSLFVFRNADHHSTGEAIFVGKAPRTLDQLLHTLWESVKPLVGPPDCLLDLNLERVQCIEQVQNGGTYLLKGKEALDVPPVFFVPRPPQKRVRYKQLCEVQVASQCEANSRPNTGASRPATSGSLMSMGSASSAFSDASGSRVGSPPCSWAMLCAPPKQKYITKTWQVDDNLRKELTHNGKNQMPVHKRYDLWTVLPRARSESSFDLWSAASVPY